MKLAEILDGPSGFVKIPAQIAAQLPPNAGMFTVTGDCMEGAGIMDGDTVIVDLDRRPRSGDPCICISRGRFLLKSFMATYRKGLYGVSTRYDFGGKAFCFNEDGSLRTNHALFASEIGGVVIGCLDQSGALRWLKDYRTFSTELPAAKPLEVV